MSGPVEEEIRKRGAYLLWEAVGRLLSGCCLRRTRSQAKCHRTWPICGPGGELFELDCSSSQRPFSPSFQINYGNFLMLWRNGDNVKRANALWLCLLPAVI
jgi:hypothetical protein